MTFYISEKKYPADPAAGRKRPCCICRKWFLPDVRQAKIGANLLLFFVDKTEMVIIMDVQSRGGVTMQQIQHYIPVTKAKSILLDLVRKIKVSDDAIAITKNGVPEVVLISMKKFQGILETLDILSDEKAMVSIRTSIRQANKGMWIDFDKVFEE